MAQLVYSAITSLDGYVADEEGSFDWAMPDEQVHQFVNDLERPVGTYLYGRRMYEVMAAWETMDTGPGTPSVVADYAQVWRSADKVVHSRSLDAVFTPRTRLERELDPDAVQHLKATTARDISIGGPELAGQALMAGLVDECRLIVTPVVVGGGLRALPAGLRLDLELREQRRFDNGMVFLRYRVPGS